MTKWMRIAALAILPALAACSDDQGPVDNDDPADDITTIRLTIGDDVVDITQGGANRGVDVPRGATSIDAAFLNANGNAVILPGTASYQLSLVPNNTSRLTFTRTGPFAGTLNGIGTGAVLLEVELEHSDHSHFGPHNVSINVLPATDN
jgi:hypothetical protein